MAQNFLSIYQIGAGTGDGGTGKSRGREAFAAFEEEELSQITVLSMEETVEEEKDGVHFRRVYTCHEEITQKSAVGATGVQNE